jgi:hypothetical protein
VIVVVGVKMVEVIVVKDLAVELVVVVTTVVVVLVALLVFTYCLLVC